MDWLAREGGLAAQQQGREGIVVRWARPVRKTKRAGMEGKEGFWTQFLPRDLSEGFLLQTSFPTSFKIILKDKISYFGTLF
jgi:hypothetical protein